MICVFWKPGYFLYFGYESTNFVLIDGFKQWTVEVIGVIPSTLDIEI